MSKSDTFENDLLKLIFNAVAIGNLADNTATSPLTNLYVALHTADPGEAGTQSTNEVSYTGYARAAVARSTAGWTVTGNSVSPVAAIGFPAGTAGNQMATHFSVGVAASGATKILYSGVLGVAAGPFTAAVSGNLFTAPAHGLAVNDRVVFNAVQSSSLPGGVTDGTLYYVVSAPSADTFTVSATQGGASITISSSGDGVSFKDVGVAVGLNITPSLGTGTVITED